MKNNAINGNEVTLLTL